MKKWFLLFVGIVVIGVCLRFNSASFYTITEIYDGDTIAVRMGGRTEKVRLIGIDTPETKDPRKPVQCFGPEASTYTKTLLEGKRIRMQADPVSTNRDRYDRLLRYVYLEDGTFYNAHLVQKGYARAYIGFPFKHEAAFSTYEQQAKTARAGLWNICENET